jgi:hypothetical protein
VKQSAEKDDPFPCSDPPVFGGFLEIGLHLEQVEAVSSGVPRRDRTYTAAVALRERLRERGISVKGLNVITEGVHSRRSRLMFEKAFGDFPKVIMSRNAGGSIAKGSRKSLVKAPPIFMPNSCSALRSEPILW